MLEKNGTIIENQLSVVCKSQKEEEEKQVVLSYVQTLSD